jgi:hypothetical protein
LKRELGFGRLLIAVYAVFAVSATARASFQLLTKFDDAPLAYSLSALAAVVYLLATIALAKPGWRRLAYLAVGFELIGVLVVGALSLLQPDLFAHPSVWSEFGSGYAYIPLALPIIGLIWLSRSQRDEAVRAGN